MTNMEYIRELLEEAKREDGENAHSTLLLQKQLDRMEGMERRNRGDLASMFLIGSKARDEEAKLRHDEGD